MVQGLADPEVKTIVLGEVEQKTELNELIKLIQAKEYAKLLGGTGSAVVSTLNENKTKDLKNVRIVTRNIFVDQDGENIALPMERNVTNVRLQVISLSSEEAKLKRM